MKLRGRAALFSLRSYQFVRILAYRWLSYGQTKGHRPIRRQPALIVGRGQVHFGENVTIGFFPSPGFLSGYSHIEARQEHARIVIGEDTQINNGSTIVAESTSIEVGRRCLIGPGVTILDSDFHALSVQERMTRQPSPAAPVRVGDDVFIGAGVTILKGVTIGAGSVIAAGSVVISEVPPQTLAAGNPAIPKRSL